MLWTWKGSGKRWKQTFKIYTKLSENENKHGIFQLVSGGIRKALNLQNDKDETLITVSLRNMKKRLFLSLPSESCPGTCPETLDLQETK
jgi:hypothetical protein